MRFLFVFLCLIGFSAHATEPTKSYITIEPDPRALKETGNATVIGVIDPLRLQLDNNKIVQLEGIDIPDMFQPDPGELSYAAKKLLENLFLNQKVIIYQSPRADLRLNRMGHEMAHVTRAVDSVWAQGILIENGLARVRTSPAHNALSAEMLEVEKTARNNSSETKDNEPPPVNLWIDDRYSVFTPETVDTAPQGFQIVDGTIKGASTVKNQIYLNFGQNWRNDFSVGIPPETRKLLSRKGLEPLTWTGKNIRVRGWLEDYNGPYIQIDHPEQIELIEPKAADTSANSIAIPPTDKEIFRDALPNIKNFKSER